MDKELAGFILQKLWFYKKEKTKKGKLREQVSKKFRDSEKFKSKEWTVDMFCKTWEELDKMGRI